MSEPLAIELKAVSKHYMLRDNGHVGFKETLLHLPSYLRQRRQRRRFTAVDQVSFSVQRGECFGLIGANGSGKSTCLALIAGVLRPDEGTVTTHGHICPLLELGGGFHPDLTGRENIFLNGVLLGMTRRQVRQKYEQIVEFSELGQFIDQQVRTYSSGMVARLGFSIAAHLDPQILLVDEVLSVGDAAFALKCERKFEEFRERGVTILMVSHAEGAIEKYCSSAVFLSHGKVAALGPTRDVVRAYRQHVHGEAHVS